MTSIIRKITKTDLKTVQDIAEVVDLWYDTSVQAHNFISPDYWKENKKAMAETYLATNNNEIKGFIVMVDNLVAALFVQTNMQGQGIGKGLLNYIKDRRNTIQLKVFKKNTKTIKFYKKQHFNILSEIKEDETGEYEFLMEWNK